MVRKANPNRREQYLDAALSLFVERGVQNTSTAEIAAAAGTASGTLFLYFASKQELVDALALRVGRQQADFIHERIRPDLSPRDTFWAIWQGSIRWFLDHHDAYRYIQQVRDTGLISPAAVQESGRYFEYYHRAIAVGRQEGAIRPYPADLIGGFLYQDIVAVMNVLPVLSELGSQDEIIRLGFDIFWNGIKTEEPQ